MMTESGYTLKKEGLEDYPKCVVTSLSPSTRGQLVLKLYQKHMGPPIVGSVYYPLYQQHLPSR
jgi:hypothetical protein